MDGEDAQMRMRGSLAAALALVLLVSAFLRFHNITHRGVLLWDEGCYLLVARFFRSVALHIPDIVSHALRGQPDAATLSERIEGWRPEPRSPKPLHGMLFGLVALVFGTKDYASFAFSGVLGVASVWLVYAFGARMFGTPAGLLAAAALASSEHHVMYSRTILAEMDSSFFFLLGAFLYYRSCEQTKRRTWLLAAAGVALSASLACNYRWFVLMPLFPLFEALRYLYPAQAEAPTRRETLRRLLILAAAVLIPLCLIQVPYMVMSLLQGRKGTYLAAILSTYSRTAQAAYLQPHTLFFKILWDLQGPVVCIALALGLLAAAWRRRFEDALASLPFLLPFVGFSLTSRGDNPRALSIALPFIALLAGRGLACVAEGVERFAFSNPAGMKPAPTPCPTDGRKLIPTFALVLLTLSVGGLGCRELLSLRSGYKDAIAFLESLGDKKHFSTMVSITRFYAGENTAIEAPETVAELKSWAKKESCRYLLVDWEKYHAHFRRADYLKDIEARCTPIKTFPNDYVRYLPVMMENWHSQMARIDAMYADPAIYRIAIYDLAPILDQL